MLFSGGIVRARGLTTPALVLSRLCSWRKRNQSLLSTASCCVYWRRRFDPAPDRDWLARNMITRRKQRRIDTLFRCIVAIGMILDRDEKSNVCSFIYARLKLMHWKSTLHFIWIRRRKGDLSFENLKYFGKRDTRSLGPIRGWLKPPSFWSTYSTWREDFRSEAST